MNKSLKKKNEDILETLMSVGIPVAIITVRKIMEGSLKALKAKIFSEKLNNDPAYQYGMKKEELFKEYVENINFDYLSNVVVEMETHSFEIDLLIFEKNLIFAVEFKSQKGEIVKEGDMFFRINKYGKKEKLGKLKDDLNYKAIMLKRKLVEINKKWKRIYVVPVLVFDDETNISAVKDFEEGIISSKEISSFILSANHREIDLSKKVKKIIEQKFKRYCMIINNENEVEKVIFLDDKIKLNNGMEINLSMIKEMYFVKKLFKLVAIIKFKKNKNKKLKEITGIIKDYQIKVKYHYQNKVKKINLFETKKIVFV